MAVGVGKVHCRAHGGGGPSRVNVCQEEGCTKVARGGGTLPKCVTHGGGRRCQHEGCTKVAKDGGTPHCRAHGGGRRCQHEGCTKSARDDTPFCILHGGGKRCQTEGCNTVAHATQGGGGAKHCKRHGGGRRCQQQGCTKAARKGGLCVAHGGGRRFQEEDCSEFVVRGSVSRKRCTRSAAQQCIPGVVTKRGSTGNDNGRAQRADSRLPAAKRVLRSSSRGSVQ